MPAEYQIDAERRIVLSRAEGLVTANELLEHQRRLGSDASFEPSMSQLYDLSAVESVAGVTGRTIRRLTLGNPFGHGAKRAIVAPSDLAFGFARQFEQMSRASKADNVVRVYRGLREARAWLGIEALR